MRRRRFAGRSGRGKIVGRPRRLGPSGRAVREGEGGGGRGPRLVAAEGAGQARHQDAGVLVRPLLYAQAPAGGSELAYWPGGRRAGIGGIRLGTGEMGKSPAYFLDGGLADTLEQGNLESYL